MKTKTTLTNQQINAIYKCTANDPLRPAMNAVFYDSGKIVSSDGYILIAISHEYSPENEGKSLDKSGKEVNGRYPNWRAVIPQYGEKLDIEGEKIFQAVKNIKSVKWKHKSINSAVIQIGRQFYSSKNIIRLMEVFKGQKFDILETGETRPLKFEGENFVAICMPVYPDDLLKVNNDIMNSGGQNGLFTIGEALGYKPFKNVKFIYDGEIVTGKQIGSFELNDLTFSVVEYKKQMYSVYQDHTYGRCFYVNYSDFTDIKNDTEYFLSKNPLKEKRFDIPEKLDREIYVSQRNREGNGYTTVSERGKIANYMFALGKTFEVVKVGTEYKFTYKGVSLGEWSADRNDWIIENLEKNGFGFVADFIKKNYPDVLPSDFFDNEIETVKIIPEAQKDIQFTEKPGGNGVPVDPGKNSDNTVPRGNELGRCTWNQVQSERRKRRLQRERVRRRGSRPVERFRDDDYQLSTPGIIPMNGYISWNVHAGRYYAIDYNLSGKEQFYDTS